MAKRYCILLFALVAHIRAQIPSLGFCPEYVPMTNFDMDKFAGVWYEAERYFQLTEVVSRCVMSNYTKGSDNKFRVSNEVTSRLTGIKRILEGEIRLSAKREEGKLIVKYTSVPLITPETSYSVLETDYDNYAVLWSCAGIGPLHTQNAWIMTRERLPPGEVLQKAYAVLDKYKISKLYFVKTNQEDCAYLDSLPSPIKKPVKKPIQQEQIDEEQPEEPARQVQPVRTEPVAPDAPEIINKIIAESAAAQEAVKTAAAIVPAVEKALPVAAIEEKIKTVPEVILEKVEPKVEEKHQPHHHHHHHVHPQAEAVQHVPEPAIKSAIVPDEPKLEPAKVPELPPVQIVQEQQPVKIDQLQQPVQAAL